MSYTLGSILFEEHISGEKNIEMHVHIGAKENEKQKKTKKQTNLCYIRIIHVKTYIILK